MEKTMDVVPNQIKGKLIMDTMNYTVLATISIIVLGIVGSISMIGENRIKLAEAMTADTVVVIQSRVDTVKIISIPEDTVVVIQKEVGRLTGLDIAKLICPSHLQEGNWVYDPHSGALFCPGSNSIRR